MLVEEQERGRVVNCLLCKTPIRTGGSSAPRGSTPTAPRG
jgi:hypothetical protein